MYRVNLLLKYIKNKGLDSVAYKVLKNSTSYIEDTRISNLIIKFFLLFLVRSELANIKVLCF